LARFAVINKGFGRGGERSGNGENKKKLFHLRLSLVCVPHKDQYTLCIVICKP
jgi:hypothetical protein